MLVYLTSGGRLLLTPEITLLVAAGLVTLARLDGVKVRYCTALAVTVYATVVLAVQQVVVRDGLLDRVKVLGTHLEQRLRAELGAHPHVGDIRGRGLFWGVELVAEREGKQWFDPARKLHVRIKSEAMQGGLMVYPSGGTVDGRCGDHVLLAPPFISTPAELEQIVSRLAQAIDRAVAA